MAHVLLKASYIYPPLMYVMLNILVVIILNVITPLTNRPMDIPSTLPRGGHLFASRLLVNPFQNWDLSSPKKK